MIIKKYNPYIIAITGSVGKTSTKEAIYSAFSGFREIRKSTGNLNTEIGAPLVFLGIEKPGEKLKEWAQILFRGLFLIFWRDKNYPEIIVVELAADKPGDISYLSRFIKPNLAIITAIGRTPVHVEFYESPAEVAKEKEKLISSLPESAGAILNKDDQYIAEMKTKAKKITFGFSKYADVVIKNFKGDDLKGLFLEIEYKGTLYPLHLPRCIGKHFAYIVSSVFAVGVFLEIPIKEIQEGLKKIQPTKGRLFRLKGINDSVILDDSYNAAPSSMSSSLDTLSELEGSKKIAVLGDMLEIGRYAAEEHREIGKKAAGICDYLFFVGDWANEMKKSSLLAGMKENQVFSFSKAEDLIPKIKEVISCKDLILVKGSQGIRLEKVVFAIMDNPENAEELLVRQSPQWKKR